MNGQGSSEHVHVLQTWDSLKGRQVHVLVRFFGDLAANRQRELHFDPPTRGDSGGDLTRSEA
jgi:hypothetical protein